jgi:hypothetical protein
MLSCSAMRNATQIYVYYILGSRKHKFLPLTLPISVDARSKAWVCGRSLAGIGGSNPAGGTDVCLL